MESTTERRRLQQKCSICQLSFRQVAEKMKARHLIFFWIQSLGRVLSPSTRKAVGRALPPPHGLLDYTVTTKRTHGREAKWEVRERTRIGVQGRMGTAGEDGSSSALLLKQRRPASLPWGGKPALISNRQTPGLDTSLPYQNVSFSPSCIARALPEPTSGLPAPTSGV